jgi:glc operon protein GlcG
MTDQTADRGAHSEDSGRAAEASSADALDDGQMQAVIERAVAAARAQGARVSIALVDSGGHLLGFARMHGVHTATVEVAQAKARCAIGFRRPTRIFAEALAAGQLALLATPGVVVLPGGIPIERSGRWLGAIGISGAAPDVDERIAQAAVDSLS